MQDTKQSMKRILAIIALALVGVSACPFKAQAAGNEKASSEALGLSLEVGADVVSSYLWRGYNFGGLSVQPSITMGWNGLYLCGWANIGADSWQFQVLNPELDITIGYENMGFALDLTHLYYFCGDKYLAGINDANNTLSSSTMELHAGIDIGEWTRVFPLSIDWYTTVLGYDPVLDAQGKLVYNPNCSVKRAYSTYIELGYDIRLPLAITLGIKAGFTPWKGYYTNYEEVWTNCNRVGITNLQLRAEREFELNQLYINVWGEAMFNCYGVTKENLIQTIGENEGQKLNARVGVGIYFGAEK